MPKEQIDYTMRNQIRAGRVNFKYYVQTQQLIQNGEKVGLNLFHPDNDVSIVRNINVGAVNTTVSEYNQYIQEVQPSTTSSNLTLIYEYFTTVGSISWTAPATVQSPITYWLVGGGGGGGGAYDNGGAGGGGGGSFLTGTYAVTPGQSYTIIVGDGGIGGSGRTSLSPPFVSTNGTNGDPSSFDYTNSGPQALGGGYGYNRSSQNANSGRAASVGTASEGGSGGGGGAAGDGGGGSFGAGTANVGTTPGIGGTGISQTFPGINSGNSVIYGIGGNGAPNTNTTGQTGTANTGKGGGGGGATSGSPGTLTKNGGNGGSGLVVIQYYA